MEGSGGVFGPGTVEVMGMPEGPRQPLSRSLPGGKNPVSVLMEYSQRSGNPIEFIITGQVGPPHDPRYFRTAFGFLFYAIQTILEISTTSPRGEKNQTPVSLF